MARPRLACYARRFIAAVAPAAARSCLALAERPAALGRLLEPIIKVPVPVLTRFVAAETVLAVDIFDARREPAVIIFCGLARAKLLPVLSPAPPGGSGRGLGVDMVLCRLIGDPSRAVIRGRGAEALMPDMNS